MIGKDIGKAAVLLEAGELVAMPTETVYGLAGNALDEMMVMKIFAVKNRPSFDPLIVHVPDLEHLKKYVKTIPEKAIVLIEKGMPGPLTLLLPKKDIIPDIVTSGLDTVAIRIPGHPMAQELLRSIDFPLAAPSANPFGYISPTSAQHVEQQLGHKIPYILDGGECKVGVESTIVGFEGEEAIIYRKGGTSVEMIESWIGPVRMLPHSTSQPQAPGMLKSHYAPKIPLEIFTEQLPQELPQTYAVLSFSDSFPATVLEVLSPDKNMEEAARNLFAAMRRLDTSGVEKIYAQLLPEEGLGRAVNDRLRRAAG